MKCPKCGYLGFEEAERCRNCGYEFSLSHPVNLPELTMRGQRAGGDGELNPLDDLALVDAAVPPQPPPTGHTSELPLFLNDDQPLITKASPPRQPLSVRRATPEVPRLRGEARAMTPMLDLGEDLEPPEAPEDLVSPAARARALDWKAQVDSAEPASVGPRIVAVLIDLLVLALVDLAIVYFTVQICGLTVDDIGILPKGPLVAFLIVQNGGYLVAFNAGGQTLGKMAMGIRVVSADPSGSIDLGHSVVRTIVWVVLAVPAGLGFVTALFSRDRRGLHDRCAGTRVVRAAA